MRSSTDRRRRSGFTLVELLVVIVILSLLAGLGGVALLGRAPSAEDDVARQLAALRRAAIHDGAPRTMAVRIGERRYPATARPDGMVFADPALRVDPTTGGRIDAAR